VIPPSSPARPVVSVPDEQWVELWPEKPDADAPVDLYVWDGRGEAPDGLRLAVLPYLYAAMAAPSLHRVPTVEVAQTLSAGYEHVVGLIPDGVRLCTAAGVHDASTAELAVGLTLAALRGIGEAAVDQIAGYWRAGARLSLADRRVLLLGTGHVGRAIAERLAPFEVELTRVGRSARDDDHGHVHGIGELASLLPRHDVVILAVPLDDSTRRLVDWEFLSLMPDGALLVNVARGPVVDTAALLGELERGRLFAALDVTEPEPLPRTHPLWRAPGVLITPHVGGNTSAFVPRGRALLREQFERFAAGQPLLNEVPLKAG
jgi:phosphoglycerate dehydrogenase-like enzyme